LRHNSRRFFHGESSVSALEAMTNAVIGLAVSWAATFFVLGYSVTQSASITAMFFGLSFSRAYLLRKAFAKWAS
jgi:hypothetical protein